jgi:uncharacterized protein with beta-barrel porin domain
MVDPKIRLPDTGHRLRSATQQSLAVLLATTALGVVSAHAVDGTWLGNNAGDPTEWIDPANWTSNPNLPDGTGTFTNNGASTTVDANGLVNIGTVSFTAAAPAYTITTNDIFLINGTGVTNNAAVTQTFNVTSSLVFQNSSSASTGPGAVTYNNNGAISFTASSTAGSATVNNNGDVEFNDNSTAGTATFSNQAVINFQDSASASSAHITNAVTGALTFNSTSTAGTATIGNSGALQFNNSSTAGSATVHNTVGATTIFSDSASAGSATFTSDISSFAAITFNNTSTAASSHIDLVDTSLAFNNSSTAGSATITMSNVMHPGNITFNDTSSAGSANITNVGNVVLGTSVQFLGASTAGSATITNNPGAPAGEGGTLFFGTLGGTDTSDAGTAHIINNQFGSTSFLANTSAANATITNNNGGNTNFQDQSTANGATIVNNSGGMTFFGVPVVGTDTATAGNALIINNAGGFTNFNALTTAGNATITNNAGGTTQFLDTSTAGSATITNVVNGITQFFNGSSASSAAINNNGGLTQFNNSSTAGTAVITTNSGGGVFFVGTSSGGQATFITNTGGVFDMSGLTSAGTTAGSIAGAGNYFLGSKMLTVGGSNLSTTVSGVISNGGLSGGIGGALTKVGTGTLTLSGINTYTGATTVNGGMLIVDGSTALSSLTTVTPGTTLAGIGTVGNTAIAGGTLVPGDTTGNVFGPLTVQGSLSFTAASTYMIQISPANAGGTNVSGTATLGGATVNAVFLPGSYVNRQYTIVNAAGGVSGTFNPTVVSNNTNLVATLDYDANDAFLNIKLKFIPPPSGTLNVNQQNVANTLTNFFNSTGSIPAAFAGLNAAGLTIASGELGTGVIQSSIKADDLFLNLLLDPSVAGRAGGFASGGGASQFAADDEASAYAAKRRASPIERDAYAMATKAPLLSAQPVNRWSVWGAAYGGSESIGGNAVVGSQDTTARVWGVVAGADYKVSPDTLLGFAVAGGGTSFTLANALGHGSSDLFQAGVFGRHNFGPAYISAALAYGWHDVTTNRTVALAGIDQLQGRFKAETFSARFEGGYRFATPMIGITPYAAAQVISFNLPAYAEQSLLGGGLFALNYAAQTTTATRTELGLRSDKSFAMQDAVLTLRGRAAWAHDYNPDRAVTAIFQALPGASFVVNGARGDPDGALVSAGAEMKWLNGFSLAATFEGEFSGNTASYSGKGVARYTW